jgi:glycosyltransferase involved in cell wall biosynthesis
MAIDIRTLSIVIPAYNEATTIASVIDAVRAVDVHGLAKEIIVVDDASVDGTRAVLEPLATAGAVRLVCQPTNRGKGAAVRAGLSQAAGEVIIIQDADLELSPGEYPKLVAPFIDDPSTQVVYGSRFLSGSLRGARSAVFANRVLTWVTNALFGARLTDMETCYKVCRADVMKSLDLRSNRFEIEPEITAKLLKRGYAIHEVAVDYQPRTRAEGKSINWKDGVRAVFELLRWRFSREG